MKELAVAGPGLMGLGIAHVAAAAGWRVRLMGRDAAAAAAGRARFESQLDRHVERGRLDRDVAAALLGQVRAVADDAELAACELAIESVPEDRALKVAVLQRLQNALPAGALIATNTSGLPVSGLATALRRPERFLGLHFFSPVERMKLVEVVRGDATSQATLRDALAFVDAIGQTPVVVRDGPGFFTSRVFAAYLDEALAMVGEGVDPATVEAAAIAGGRSIGPLAFFDEVTLGLNLQQADQARADGLPPRFCRTLARPVLERMVALGRNGRRDGGGFHDFHAGGARALWPGLATAFPTLAAQPPLEAVATRLRVAEALEALCCLEEGVVGSADDADTASRLGLGLRAGHGGVLASIERDGLDRFVAAADGVADAVGERLRPSPWLRLVAAEGNGLAAWRRAVGAHEPENVA